MSDTATLEPSMVERIATASIYELSFAYCRWVDLPWLGWPLGRMPYNDKQHLRDLVETVVKTPRCNRTSQQCWKELRAITNDKLQKVLASMPEANP